MNRIRTPLALAAAALLAATAFAQALPPPADAQPPIDGPAARPPAPDADRGPGARAPRGPRPGDELGRAGPETTLTGRVARWLVNPNGDVDGLLLDDGTQVSFAPHLSASLLDAVKAKDAVEITGRRGENAKVVRASTIKSTRSGRSVATAARDPEAAPPPPRPVGALAAMNASGRIDTLLYTGRGDVNGALLQDGTVVRFPPHAMAQMSDALKPGAVLYARGYGTRSAQGSALEATAIGSTAENAREVFAGPGPRGGARPPVPPIGDRMAPADAPPVPPSVPPRAPA